MGKKEEEVEEQEHEASQWSLSERRSRRKAGSEDIRRHDRACFSVFGSLRAPDSKLLAVVPDVCPAEPHAR